MSLVWNEGRNLRSSSWLTVRFIVQKNKHSDPEMKTDSWISVSCCILCIVCFLFHQRSAEVKQLLLYFCVSHLLSTDLRVHVTLIKTTSSSSAERLLFITQRVYSYETLLWTFISSLILSDLLCQTPAGDQEEDFTPFQS